MTTPTQVDAPSETEILEDTGDELRIRFPCLIPENYDTGDGRFIELGALTHRVLPLPILAMTRNPDGGIGHDGAEVIGRFDTLVKTPGSQVKTRAGEPFGDDVAVWSAEGVIDGNHRAAELARRGYLRGVSVDLTDVDAVEYGPEEMAASDNPRRRVSLSSGVISGLTMCPIPAFADAYGDVVDGPDPVAPEDIPEALAASALPSWRSAELGDWSGLVAAGVPQGQHTGAMVALIPSEADAARLAVDGGLAADDLHVTLLFLGEAIDWNEDQQGAVRNAVSQLTNWDRVEAQAWAPSIFNPPGVVSEDGKDRTPCLTYLINGDSIDAIRGEVGMRVTDIGNVPEQHSIFTPHITITEDIDRIGDLTEVGPLVLDRVRVAFGGDVQDYPLRAPDAMDGEGAPVPAPPPARPTTVTAAGSPALPPIEWYRDPGLTELTPLTITDDGRVFGHIADWLTPHIGINGKLMYAPRSRTDYSYFHTGAAKVVGDDGQPVDISVGKLTLDTGHADINASYRAAISHYENTGAIVATVCAGEDEFGVWCSGALAPGLDDLRLYKLRACGLSGDWRPIKGQLLEMVAALSVPTGGFPIPRARVASGQILALTAAGAVRPAPGAVDIDELTDAVVAALARRDNTAALTAEHSALLAELDDTPQQMAALLAELGAAEDGMTAQLRAELTALRTEFDTARYGPERDALLASLEVGEFDPKALEVNQFGALEKVPGVQNWIERLPAPMRAAWNKSIVYRAAVHMHRERGMAVGHAIASALQWSDHICVTGDVKQWKGPQSVNPKSRAECCAALALWESMKAAAKADNG